MNVDLAAYYAQRAREYERIYEKPERQSDLRKLKQFLMAEFAGTRLLEVACGTGYWTQVLAETARSIVAFDINKEVIEVANSKNLPSEIVEFKIIDLYNLTVLNSKFDAVFAGFIWSHIAREELSFFIDAVHERISKHGQVVFVDNRYVEGNSTPIFKTDERGNTYQKRILADTEHLVLKNFPTPDEITDLLSFKTKNLELINLDYYWILKYKKV